MKKLLLLSAAIAALVIASPPPPEHENRSAAPQGISAKGPYDKIAAVDIVAGISDIARFEGNIKQAGRSTDTKVAAGVISFESAYSASDSTAIIAVKVNDNPRRATSAEVAQGGAPPTAGASLVAGV